MLAHTRGSALGGLITISAIYYIQRQNVRPICNSAMHVGLWGHFRHRTHIYISNGKWILGLQKVYAHYTRPRLRSLNRSPQDLILSAVEALKRKMPVVATLVRKSTVATKLPRNMKLAQHNSFVLIYCFSTRMCRYQMEDSGTVKIALSHGFPVRVAVCGILFEPE